jgi:hypothetical protein
MSHSERVAQLYPQARGSLFYRHRVRLTGYGRGILTILHTGKASTQLKKNTPWSESASELYRASDRRLSAKWLPTCADRRCHVVSVTDLRPYSRFSRQVPLFFYQVAPQLYSRGWVDPVPDPLLFFFGSAGNRTGASGSVAKNSDHRGGRLHAIGLKNYELR